MFQLDEFAASGVSEANVVVRAIGDVLPQVLAQYGLADGEPELEVEFAEAELVSA